MKLQKAQRDQVKLRLGLSGASGFGKTYSALLLAHGISNDWSKVAIIDTEHNSACLYTHLGEFRILTLNAPYSPERFIEAIRTCEQAAMNVIIIDSISHEWMGSGGCLDLHEKLGGRFQDWARITPRHTAYMDAILESKSHIITTVRRKIDYSMNKDSNGRMQVVKHGTKEITKSGWEYELTVNFELINDKHFARASKDRTGLFSSSQPEFIINKSTGKKLIAWCNGESSRDQALIEIQKCTTVEGLKHIYDKYSSIQSQIKPMILERKVELETINNQIVDEKTIE